MYNFIVLFRKHVIINIIKNIIIFSRYFIMRGGHSGVNYSLSPENYDGQGVGTSGNAVQFEAGMAGGRRRRRGSRRGGTRHMGGRRRRSRRGGEVVPPSGGARRRSRRARRSRRSRR